MVAFSHLMRRYFQILQVMTFTLGLNIVNLDLAKVALFTLGNIFELYQT